MIRDYITMTMLTMMMLMKKAQKATATLIQKKDGNSGWESNRNIKKGITSGRNVVVFINTSQFLTSATRCKVCHRLVFSWYSDLTKNQLEKIVLLVKRGA